MSHCSISRSFCDASTQPSLGITLRDLFLFSLPDIRTFLNRMANAFEGREDTPGFLPLSLTFF